MLNTDNERPLHIALWSPAWPLAQYQNGIITYVHWMRPALEALGHRVSIFAGEVASDQANSEVYPIRRRIGERVSRWLLGKKRSAAEDIFLFSRLISADILRVHRRDPIDVLEMEESFGWHAYIAQRTGIPVLVRLHGPAFLSLIDEELRTDFGKERIEREGAALRLAKAIVSPCRATLLQTLERHNVTSRHAYHVVYPVALHQDTALWDLANCDRNTILFVGRFDLRKGADVVLRAFKLALREHRELRLVFVGPDLGLPSPNGLIHFEQYLQGLLSPEFRSRVEYRGRMSNQEVTKLRTRCMVTVIGSRWENPGYTLLEALLQGCPVVSTDAGGCPEHIVHEVTGRLARSEDPTSFATEMLAIINDPVSAARLGEAGRRSVLKCNSPHLIAIASVEIYRSMLSRMKLDSQL